MLQDQSLRDTQAEGMGGTIIPGMATNTRTIDSTYSVFPRFLLGLKMSSAYHMREIVAQEGFRNKAFFYLNLKEPRFLSICMDFTRDYVPRVLLSLLVCV